jgi:CRISPR-associated endonuclease Csn1
MDALTVAFTTHSHIQYLNNLSASRDAKNNELYGIRNKITETVTQKNGSKKRVFTSPMSNFREEAKTHIKSILISFKTKNKVVTQNINRTKTGDELKDLKKIQLTPRGQLHKETVYAKRRKIMNKATKLSSRFGKEQAQLIVDEKVKCIVLKHLESHNDKPSLAFAAKTLKKDPLELNGKALKEVICYEEFFTIRKPITPDLKLAKVVDSGVRTILQARLDLYSGNAKEAFSDLEKNPIWMNEDKGIAIKRVAITGVSNAEPLHRKRGQDGKVLLRDGSNMPSDYVSTGNNHHVAIYEDETGNLQEMVVSFYEAVARVNAGVPIVDKSYKQDQGWRFLFTMKQNEMFLFPSDNFNPSELDLLNHDNYSELSPHLFRVQKIATKNYFFRHHLETTVENNKSLSGIAYKSQLGLNRIVGILKVRMNHIGKIVYLGEY